MITRINIQVETRNGQYQQEFGNRADAACFLLLIRKLTNSATYQKDKDIIDSAIEKIESMNVKQ